MWRRFRYLLLLVGLCSLATCPAAKRSCTARAKAREADQLLEYLVERVTAVVAATGRVPPLAAGPTPLPSCCDIGGTCEADPAVWSAPGWQALRFTIDGEYRYTYAYLPDPSGRSATLRAVGDLDCDGESSLYEVELAVEGLGVQATWTRRDPYE
ncbi:MAG: hypothetical protein KF773_32485 [Deltaproteobacteria bacterium]|nr:hypothetical protein [Deltaproteobacteria bacterium]MCW5808918.1 hypothetical protein [Deltaproteobacteria bacterium]